MTASTSGRILGIDAGERRIGVSISDPGRSFALPLKSLQYDPRGSHFGALAAIVSSEDVSEVVVGLPLSLSGESSAQTQRARDFAADLEQRLGLPVHLWDERLSTREAMRRTSDSARGNKGKGRQAQADTDALAASIILQAYLDRLRFERS
jgi:putative holliday junction resolvase